MYGLIWQKIFGFFKAQAAQGPAWPRKLSYFYLNGRHAALWLLSICTRKAELHLGTHCWGHCCKDSPQQAYFPISLLIPQRYQASSFILYPWWHSLTASGEKAPFRDGHSSRLGCEEMRWVLVTQSLGETKWASTMWPSTM